MDIINVVAHGIQVVFRTAFGFFNSLGPAIIVSLLTAVVSVQLTFWYHDRRDRRNALKAFESEIRLNDMETEMMIHNIYGERDGFEDDSDTRTTVRLATSSYDEMKTSGTLTRMPENAKESIRSYYTLVRLINNKLQQREDVRYNLPWQKQDQAIETVDSRLLNDIGTICGPARLEMVADRLSDNDEVEEYLLECAEDKKEEDVDESAIYGDYEEVLHHISNELESLRVLPRWSDLEERVPGR